MDQLNLPIFNFRTRLQSGKEQIFDDIRKKFVALTPEEWVRQHFLQFLIQEKKYPASRMAVEFGLHYNSLKKRGDIVFFNKEGAAEMIVECKAPSIKISQDTFDQAARYNFVLQVKYLVITNGMQHYCCEMDNGAKTYQYMPDIPVYME